uniref:Uncharacterized protein n=1 Tax=Vespula pensylvanica TaxID=30213 RepID=A0A834JIK0_VESPE|nr:hypothetical protein H0235_017882 [Vespula pensylvanica]
MIFLGVFLDDDDDDDDHPATSREIALRTPDSSEEKIQQIERVPSISGKCSNAGREKKDEVTDLTINLLRFPFGFSLSSCESSLAPS